mmetsp:Transcript_140549/g.199239  ORF Transcript_140549/g.199239 Transcript_140549/m.199239 type:complete len:208 (-) Transcript_140549:203-826(-)
MVCGRRPPRGDSKLGGFRKFTSTVFRSFSSIGSAGCLGSAQHRYCVTSGLPPLSNGANSGQGEVGIGRKLGLISGEGRNGGGCCSAARSGLLSLVAAALRTIAGGSFRPAVSTAPYAVAAAVFDRYVGLGCPAVKAAMLADAGWELTRAASDQQPRNSSVGTNTASKQYINHIGVEGPCVCRNKPPVSCRKLPPPGACVVSTLCRSP